MPQPASGGRGCLSMYNHDQLHVAADAYSKCAHADSVSNVTVHIPEVHPLSTALRTYFRVFDTHVPTHAWLFEPAKPHSTNKITI